MSTIPKGAREFLATGPFAHIVTLNPDGTPHVSLAWAGVDDDDGIIWSSFSDQRKLDNLRRDPRITLSFQAHESGGEPLHPYLVIRGRATIEPGGALDVMDRLAEFYIGPRAEVPHARPPARPHRARRRRRGVWPGLMAPGARRVRTPGPGVVVDRLRSATGGCRPRRPATAMRR
jgi:PPOX class probable F420-dependent enzyme